MDSRLWRALVLMLVLGLALGTTACRQQQEPATSPENGENQAAEEPPVDTAEEAEAVPESQSKVPLDTYVSVTIGEPESLDPAWTYETTGAGIESQIYDGLVYFNREKADEFVPSLATDWTLSEDGTIYTFNIRDGVTFHEGGTLEPHDIAYSIQRAMLQDRADGPMWLFLEPILATSSIEQLALETAGLAEDEAATLDDVPADVTTALCELIQSAVTADDEAGTVSIIVQQPTPWLLQLLAQVWGAALDQEWMVERGDWDGSCETWTEYHSPAAEESTIFDSANGTGPYTLGTWKKGEEITLDAYPDYWRTEPIWEGGPSGPARIEHIVLQKVDEWGTRFAKLSAGEADAVVVPRAEISQVDPMVETIYHGGDESAESEISNEGGPLKLFVGYPTVSMTAAMFNFDINPESEFIGTGELGEGIPPDFFNDINVRRGFNYCFDWETYIAEGLQGEGIQARGPIIEGLQGFDPNSDVYAFDPEKCAEELALAWEGQVAEQGFKMTLAYNEGNDTRKMAAQILAEGLAAVDPEKYQVQVVDLEWPSFLEARRAESLPISISGWLEDYHDASNWAHPFMHSKGAYARAQGFPEEMQTVYDELIDQGVLETDDAAREEIYTQLQQKAYEDAINIFLEQATGRSYMNKEVTGWYVNPLAPSTWYYSLEKVPAQ